MATTTETVFVEFVLTGDKAIEDAQKTLERTGKVDKAMADEFKKTNAELAKRQKIIDNLNKELRETQAQNAKTIGDLEAKLEKFITDFVEGFSEGIVETLKEAGLEFDEFGQVVNKNNKDTEKSTNTLKARLSELTAQIAKATAAGETHTDQFKAMVTEAGNLRDSLQNVNKQINLAADGERNLHGLMEVAHGIAAGFAIAESATALFGGSSEELNEVLVNVTSSLALMQGIETLINITKKESAAFTLVQTVAQKAYNIVVGESIGLLKAFRIALAATGIGLAILAIGALVVWLQRSSRAVKELTQDFTAFNNATTIHIQEVNQALATNARILEENQARARARGAVQSDLAKQEIADLRTTFQAIFQLEQQQRERAIVAKQTLDEISAGERSHNKELEAELQKTVDNYEATKNRRLDIANEIRTKEIENEKQIRVERLQAAADTINARLALATKNSKQEFDLARQSARAQAALELEAAGENASRRFLIEKQLQDRLREIDREYAIIRQEDRIAAAERELLATEQRSKEISDRVKQDEIDAQKKVIAETSRLALMQEGLTANQRLQIIEKSLADQNKLQKDFNQQSSADALSDFIARNNSELTNLNLTNGERLRLQEENLIAQAQIEIDKNKGLADQIKAIRAKLNEDLRALMLASIEKTLSDELSLEQSRTGALRRASERIAANELNTLSKRIAAINQIAALDIAAINKKDDALEKSFRDQLISQEEYNRRHAALVDEELKVEESAELTKRQLRQETMMRTIEFTLNAASQIASIIQQFGQNETEREQQQIDAQREAIDELREAGAITEKEALARQKRLDNEEKAIKRRQAERDKAIAIFQAIINTASAITRALATGGPVLAAIVAALGAAQVAAIASRPIPRFGKGKKNSYEGPAEIGETGPELMESNGEMFLAKKKTFVWLGKKDKVFNPQETIAMLNKGDMQPYIVKGDEEKEYRSVYQNNIDYDKLGKVISSNLPQVALDINEHGFTQRMIYNNALVKYLDDRRSYK